MTNSTIRPLITFTIPNRWTPEQARPEQEHDLALSDEDAAYIADALMQLALEFENNYYAQIRRHYQSIAPEPESSPARTLP